MSEPRRIVSLVPSDTYTLARLGVLDRLVGRTDYCVAPREVALVPSFGGTKNVDVEAIVACRPDLVVANQEENRKHDIERLLQAGVPVLVSFPCTVREGLLHVERLAALFPSVAPNEAIAVWRCRLEVHEHAVRANPVPTFMPIWMDPLMTANSGAFLSDVIELCGGRNVFADRERRYPLRADLGLREAVPAPGRDTRYPRIALDEVEARRPMLVLLPDEPHEFKPEDANVFASLPCRPAVRFVDGKAFMWYGWRSLEALDETARLFAACATNGG
ncbi:MAG: ABC transporter substrate-binding protein [Deltaproteobacteria bacterium]|nr:ABC transporter substrate-binding protein [Deltaproteobacteria bacterium]